MARTWDLFGWRPEDAPADPFEDLAMTAARLVVFDVDGTLIDSQHLILAAMARAFAAAGHALPERAAVLGVVGLSLPEAMAALAPHLPETETLLLAEHYRESFVDQRASRRRRGACAALSRARSPRSSGWRRRPGR